MVFQHLHKNLGKVIHNDRLCVLLGPDVTVGAVRAHVHNLRRLTAGSVWKIERVWDEGYGMRLSPPPRGSC
jgi:hypothetical protein